MSRAATASTTPARRCAASWTARRWARSSSSPEPVARRRADRGEEARELMEALQGKTAVVTGGASGMGRAFCDRFARAGMAVVVADVEQGALDAAVARVIGVRCDVSKAEDHEAVLAAALQAFERVNVVCLNAGVGGANGRSWTLSLDDWRWTLDVNLW